VVDSGSGQGRNEFETNGKAVLRRRRSGATSRIALKLHYVLKGVRTPAWAERCHLCMGTKQHYNLGPALWLRGLCERRIIKYERPTFNAERPTSNEEQGSRGKGVEGSRVQGAE
jgi:hypothetical protein